MSQFEHCQKCHVFCSITNRAIYLATKVYLRFIRKVNYIMAVQNFLYFLFLIASSFLLWSCSGVIDEASLAPGPLAADSLTISPSSPSNDTTPTVSGTATTSASLKLYDKPNCSGLLVGTGSSTTSGSFSITSTDLIDGYHSLSVLTTSHSTGQSICSTNSVDYVVDTIAPIYSIGAPSANLVNINSPALTFETDYITTATVNLLPTHILLNTIGTANCQISIANATTPTPTVSLSACTGDGLVQLSFDTGTASDSAGNRAGTANARGTFIVDNTGLTSVTYNPSTGIYSTVPSNITVAFAETIDGTTVTAADFSVTGTCSTLPNVAVQSAIGSTVTLNLTGAICALGENITLTTNLGGISDPIGNPGTGSVSATYTIDNIGPTSAVFNPGAARFSTIPTTVTATFNEAVTPASVTDADFIVSGTCTTLPMLSVTQVVGTTATFSLTGADCILDETVIITLDFTNTTDTTGNAGVGSSSVTYTFDDVGPMATSINPVTASVAAIPTSISVTFTENLLASSLADSDLIINGTCATLPTVTLSSVNTATATFTLANDSCTNGQTVIVTMNGSEITDAAGNAGTGSVSASYTFDDIGPMVSSVAPTTATVNAIPANVTFYFDEPLLSTSVDATDVNVTGTCSTLPTLSLVNVSGATAIFSLTGANCATGETTILTMDGSSVTDSAANAGAASITATYTVDSTGPSPSSISPASASFITMPTSISVAFDESVLASSVTPSDLDVAGTCATLPSVSVTNVAGSIITFTLIGGNCNDGETLSISAFGSNVTDLSGNIGTNNQTVTYTKDLTGPSVLSFSPATNIFISSPTLVNITFDEPLSATSVTAADFTIGGTCQTLPTHAISSVSGQQVIINLSGAVCNNNETIILTVLNSGINDALGNTGSGTSDVTYTIDNTGPTISSITPNTGAPPTAITIGFSENLNPSTVSLADFSLGGTCSSKILNLVSVINNTVNIEIAGGVCGSGETVTITIDASGIVDTIGNAGAGTSFVTFTEL